MSACPACGGGPSHLLHDLAAAPTTDVELFKSQAQAKAVPHAPIALMACEACGFAWNAAFDPGLVVYHQGFESTQIHSPTFRASLQGLVDSLCAVLPEGNGLIVEAGCGQGELITQLCDSAGRRGLGIDPAYRGEEVIGGIRFRSEEFDASTITEPVDLLVCKMTLEHLWQPLAIVEQFAQALAANGLLFIQVPRFEQAVVDGAYWDVYYEHCNYFSEASLTALCARAGLRPQRLWQEYRGQYVLGLFTRGDGALESASGMALADYRQFADGIGPAVDAWRRWFGEPGRRAALWGGGSKAVSFLTHLGVPDAIEAAIDINPDKRNSYLPGSGLPVIGPEDAAGRDIEAVTLMNPVYREEVAAMLAEIGLGDCPLLDIGQPPGL